MTTKFGDKKLDLIGIKKDLRAIQDNVDISDLDAEEKRTINEAIEAAVWEVARTFGEISFREYEYERKEAKNE